MKTLLSTKQTAEHCGISPRTLESWRISGHGPMFRKIGRLVRYVQSDIDAWLDENRHQNTTTADIKHN